MNAKGVIVVGVDGSAGSLDALRWAIEQAARTGQPVRALRAWSFPASVEWTLWSSNYGPVPLPGIAERREVQANAEKTLAEVVGAVAGPDCPATIEQQAIEGHPAEVLVAAATAADLLVVGRRGHGGFAGLRLGSVSRHCVDHAPCPVVVIPPAVTRERT